MNFRHARFLHALCCPWLGICEVCENAIVDFSLVYRNYYMIFLFFFFFLWLLDVNLIDQFLYLFLF